MKTIKMERLRSCTARIVTGWDKADVKNRLYGKGDTREGQFCLLESMDFPTNETHFDVARDRQFLYVSVMTHTSGDMGRLLQGFEGDSNVVEALFDPFHDHLGLLQYGCGDLGDTYENTHWPYRDAVRNEFLDLPWSVEVEATKEKPDAIHFFFFRFDLRAFHGNRCVGFNVARSQAAIRENSSWNRVSGMGFPDPDCLGHLWLEPPDALCESAMLRLDGDRLTAIEMEWAGESAAACSVSLINPCGEEIANLKVGCKGHACLEPETNFSLDTSGRYRLVVKTAEGENVAVEPDEFFFDHQASADVRPFQFQGTYDWPDHVLNVPYSPDDLRREMAWYKEMGLERVYWLDYNHYDSEKARTRQSEAAGRNLQRTNELFGSTDHLVTAAEAARKAGLEFVTVFKPFEQPMAFMDADILHDRKYFMRRNPDWSGRTGLPIRSVRLFQRDESPFPFTPLDVRVWYARDGGEWTAVRGDPDVTEKLVERAECVNSPAGVISGEVARRVRSLEIGGLSLVADRIAIECLRCDRTLSLRNRQYMFAELDTADGAAVIGILRIHEGGSPAPGDEDDGSWWRDAGGSGHQASWARMDTNADQISTIRAKQIALEFDLNPPLHMDGILEPAFPEVRSFWLEYLKRGLDAGADGVGLRIAHHTRCYDWLGYMFAEPVLAEFRNQFGRAPEPIAEDFTRIRRIRGAFYTQFLREAKAMAEGAGKKLILHVENRMIVPAEGDCYTQIFWDWRTWVKEGLADEIDLKYLGPNQQAAYREIVPLARKHGIKVNWVSADPEPRGHPRSIHEAPLIARRAAEAGLDGINLYELWLYRRMTQTGYPMTRGSGEAIIRKIRACLDGLS
ncbi:MAG: hypothetical protein O3B01_31025 [Planctomycetota bacterium]|nr:hypothetical protein [Planctomycetota bacterium]